MCISELEVEPIERGRVRVAAGTVEKDRERERGEVKSEYRLGF